jgi:hypothetical protein
MEYFYTYKISFVDGHYYYGSRKSSVKPEDDIYWGSPKTHKDKWRTCMFSKTILNVVDNYDRLRLDESKLIGTLYKTDPFCLNEHNGNNFYRETPHSEETKQKISEAQRRMTDETKRKLSEAGKRRTHSEATKRKIGESQKGNLGHFYGKTHSQETCQKIKDSLKIIGHQQGSTNSQFGKMWITNGTHSYRIDKVDSIPEGYRKGRVIKSSV